MGVGGIMRKKRSRAAVIHSAAGGCNAWFHNVGRCLAAGWSGLDDMPDKRECWGRLEQAHVKPRKDKCVFVSPDASVLLCHGHHSFFDGTGLMRKFIEDLFPGRYDDIEARILEHRLAGNPRLYDYYEFMDDFYKSRPEDESYMDWLALGLEAP